MVSSPGTRSLCTTPAFTTGSPVRVTEGAKGDFHVSSAHLAMLRTAILDLRANLEHKARVARNIEGCIERYAADLDDAALRQIESHLITLRELHGVTTEMIFTADATVEGLRGDTGTSVV
jgi:hypothetical protein